MSKRVQSPEARQLLREHPCCELCGDKRNLEAHHIVPVCCGGSNNINNLIVVCGICHSKLTPKAELTKVGKDYFRRIHAMRLRYYELADQFLDNGSACFADAFDALMSELEDRTFDPVPIEQRANDRYSGRNNGDKLTTTKSIVMKPKIVQLSKDFEGMLTDKDVISALGIARNTYYKYKKELLNERQTNRNVAS